jgi:hypothetical protein
MWWSLRASSASVKLCRYSGLFCSSDGNAKVNNFSSAQDGIPRRRGEAREGECGGEGRQVQERAAASARRRRAREGRRPRAVRRRGQASAAASARATDGEGRRRRARRTECGGAQNRERSEREREGAVARFRASIFVGRIEADENKCRIFVGPPKADENRWRIVVGTAPAHVNNNYLRRLLGRRK